MQTTETRQVRTSSGYYNDRYEDKEFTLFLSKFPEITHDSWCGEFRPKSWKFPHEREKRDE
jgi:hypothetical protein